MFTKRISTGVRYKTASELNCLITFQKAVGAENDGTLNPPTTVWTAHANIAMWRGREDDKTQQRNAASSFKITMRYSKQFVPTSDMTILYHGQTYNIESVSDIDGQQVQIEIWAWIENDGLNA
ncbi:MAG TPA: phage head closure protein [Terriglobales bacterium]|nr:phage head closure protein [Terriglobales bacterium]